MSFTEINIVKAIHDQWVQTNLYTHFPHLLSGLDDIWFKSYVQNTVQICKFLENRCSGSCNFPRGINEITFTHSTKQNDFLK